MGASHPWPTSSCWSYLLSWCIYQFFWVLHLPSQLLHHHWYGLFSTFDSHNCRLLDIADPITLSTDTDSWVRCLYCFFCALSITCNYVASLSASLTDLGISFIALRRNANPASTGPFLVQAAVLWTTLDMLYLHHAQITNILHQLHFAWLLHASLKRCNVALEVYWAFRLCVVFGGHQALLWYQPERTLCQQWEKLLCPLFLLAAHTFWSRLTTAISPYLL